MNISDITILDNNKRGWYLEGPLEHLRSYLPLSPPTGQSPLLTGQYWKLQHQLQTYNLQINDVIRIDGLYGGKVVITRYKRTGTSNRVRHCENQIQVPQQFLFQKEHAILPHSHPRSRQCRNLVHVLNCLGVINVKSHLSSRN